jgi:polysaccharide export outer membrane protein
MVLAVLSAPLQGGAADYVLGPDDVLQVSFWQQPDLNTVARIRQDGRISLPVVGDMSAADLTVSELEDRIVDEISVYNREISQARVEVIEYNSQKVFVSGEVYRPGKYTFEFIPNLWEVIREAGGPREQAMLSEVAIIRSVEGEGEKFTVNLTRALESGNFAALPKLKPGDTVIVPRLPTETAGATADILGRSVVFIYGQISRPGVYAIEESSTLLQVIAQAGGPTELADLGRVRVLVKQGARSAVATVDVEEHARRGHPPDFLLHPGDTVVIPQRGGLLSNVWGGLSQVLGVTSGILGIFYIVDRFRE